jgi:hypothetical protein
MKLRKLLSVLEGITPTRNAEVWYIELKTRRLSQQEWRIIDAIAYRTVCGQDKAAVIARTDKARMTDDEYQQALAVLQSLLVDEQWIPACHLRNGILREGRSASALDRDTASPTMAIMRKVHKDMKAGVSVQRSSAVHELLSFMKGGPLTPRHTRQRRREPASNGKVGK